MGGVLHVHACTDLAVPWRPSLHQWPVSTRAFWTSRAGSQALVLKHNEGKEFWADVHAEEKVSRVDDLGPRGLGKGNEFLFVEENWIMSF
jgi:hypothetical protein